MPNTRGGKSFKRGKKPNTSARKTETPIVENPNQRYGCVLRKLGGKRLEINCSDSEVRHGIIPGSFYKKLWMNVGDIVLVEVSETNKKECFITHKYDNYDARNLRSRGLINFDVKNDDDKKDVVFGDDMPETDDNDIYKQMENAADEPTDDAKQKKLTRRADKKVLDQKRRDERDSKEVDFESI